MSETYHWLIACGQGGDPFDRHVFACILAKGLSEAPRPLAQAVGLGRSQLAALLAAHFPAAQSLLEGMGESTGEDSLEEPDLRALLAGNATQPGSAHAQWLAAMVARRSLQPNHLWQDLGLAARQDLSGLLNRHFAPLAVRNVRDMKWKKFFYRELCADEGVAICKSPVCDTCADFPICYGPEE